MTQRFPTLVKEVMTERVLALRPDQNLAFLEESMRLFRFRHMPVTVDDKLVGLVTARDVVRASASSLSPDAAETNAKLSRSFSVADIMTRDVATANPSTTLIAAARLMEEQKLGCLPVVVEDNLVVGIITEADFVRLARQMLESQSDEQ